MRLTIFGATGATGTQLVRQALEAGHEVTAVVRDPARLTVAAHQALRVVTAEVTDPAGTATAVRGADAVITAIGPRGKGPTSASTDGARGIVRAMGETGSQRLVLTSSSALAADAGDGPFTRYVVKPAILQPLFKDRLTDLLRAEEAVRASALDWTIVRPPQLTDNPAKGSYRTATDTNVKRGYRITRADLAACVLGLLDDGASIRRHISVAN
ncbi:Putative NADH-flavin reductase [Streptomyces sp. DvalAA-14]|uniref:NAD(P)-dependent oxidoreductase n=1 Tax=unclassified Streptomyces TaxID=2593676 RepID=UPI00081B2772|nr:MULTISPECIES: NAD(P)-binding oxidoreductase [unclassified Streptomyces]MYS23055.1 NAD(P)H-binding protein [Streptomyces sp. SID4948]SCE26634.1 Putative NADH-flavin reductase [Streptomyces sp. DvalAA-14]